MCLPYFMSVLDKQITFHPFTMSVEKKPHPLSLTKAVWIKSITLSKSSFAGFSEHFWTSGLRMSMASKPQA